MIVDFTLRARMGGVDVVMTHTLAFWDDLLLVC